MTAIILQGDARRLPLPDATVDLIVTRPPYFGQRVYTDAGRAYDGQIGAEASPLEYVAALLDCTREWVRVLKPAGSLFVVLGDKYATRYSSLRGAGRRSLEEDDSTRRRSGQNRTGVPEKSLLGLPWRYALGCVDELGLILRADIPWSKPNGMPESVTDRVRRSHEQVFHFAKSPRYFAAVDEIREPHQPQSLSRARRNRFAPDLSQTGVGSPNTLNPADSCNPLGKLPGSVWEIATQPLAVPAHLGVEHFAAYPTELPRRIILGWSPTGICTACGDGRRPVTAYTGEQGRHPGGGATYRTMRPAGGRDTNLADAALRPRTITGYACACPNDSAPTHPAVVVDPFGGTGTTALVADVYGRTGITIDRSADYCRIAQWRTSDPAERARALGVPKPPPVVDGQGSLFDREGEAV